MTELCQAPPLLVVEPEPSAPRRAFSRRFLLAKKRYRVLMFTLSPRAQRRQDELK
jgi:hypothetical protein